MAREASSNSGASPMPANHSPLGRTSVRAGSRMWKACSRKVSALARISSSESIGRVELRPLGSPTRAVQSPITSTAMWPASWNSRSLPSTTQ